jgi:phenylalanyl-tRNA synthetase beta chain
MRVSLNWLKDYVDFNMTVDEIDHAFTMLGFGVDAVERPGADVKNVVIGRILSIQPHPDADKLVVCRTDIGRGEPLQIVCGAKNMKEGDIVPTAVIGATLVGGFEIGKRKMRGIESQGMMCSARELGLGDDHTGLLIMDPATPVGEDALPILGLDDVILDLDITPNRGDWASMIGVARELAALLGTRVKMPQVRLQESDFTAESLSSVVIENADLCPRYVGRVLTDVKIGPSPDWMCRRLIAAGQRPISNIVDITNFVMLELGHPLHAFDYDLLKENRIVVRNPRPGETITTIDGQVRALSPDMLIIADAQEPVAVGGVMGGLQSEVGDACTRVFLEGAMFKPTSIRRTARALGMQSEASMRFQRGADPEMAAFAVDRAAMLMQQLAGAKVAGGRLDEYPNKKDPIEITLRYERTGLLLGTRIEPPRQQTILESLGFEITGSAQDHLTARVPSWRHDAEREADLIEEIARLYGYENIESTLPRIQATETVFAPNDSIVRAFRRYLVGQGLTEFFNWTFSCPEDVKASGLPDEFLNMVALQNPLSEKQATMRSSLIPGLLANVSRNVRHGSLNVRAFEIGPVYIPVTGRDLPDEPLRVGVVLTGYNGEKHWAMPQQPLDIYDVKGFGESILEFFGADAAFEVGEYGPFESGQCARVALGETTLGWMGQMRFDVLKGWGIDQPVFMLELDLSQLLECALPMPQFRPIPAFPPSRRDMAVMVDAGVPAGALRDAAMETGGKLLKSVDIFDVYSGKQVTQGKKSIALSLVFQSDERTLTDQDTQKSWDRILKKLQTDFGAELR